MVTAGPPVGWGEDGQQVTDAGVDLRRGAAEGGVALPVGVAGAAGSGMLQWISRGWSPKSGQTSRTLSHRLIT